MTDLIGTSLLGNIFVQDANANFVKIDGVTVGESQQYGYDTRQGTVGELLDVVLNDTRIVVLIYNWETNTGYFKTGFNMGSTSDSKTVPGVTSYIIKSRVVQPTIVTPTVSIPSVTPYEIKSLLNCKIFNTPFQKHNDRYLKITGVAIGENSHFALDTKTGPIDTLLSGGDNVIVYNAASGIGYVKSGFNLSDPSDSKINREYVSYVKITAVTEQNLNYFKYGSGSVKPGIEVNGFVKANGNKLVLNGNPFVAVGYNAFFMGLLQETMKYPTYAQVEEVFRAARLTKATTIRAHTLGFSSGTSLSLTNGTTINESAWDIIDYAFMQAKRYGIKLVLPLTDAYQYYNGSYGVFCSPDGTPKDQFFTASGPRTRFKQYIYQYLTHVNKYTGVAIKDAVEVGFIELGNELGNIRPEAGSTAIPTQEWLNDISTYVKSIDKNHLVMSCSDECLGSQQSNDFVVSNLDCYSAHFYWFDWERLRFGAQKSSEVGKPYIIGEYDSGWNDTWYRGIEGMGNVSGSITWSIYPHEDGTQNGNRVPHGDGFTIWYDNKDANNTSKLTFLTNHFRRMQGLSEVVSPF